MKKIIISVLLLFVCVFAFTDITTEQSLLENINLAKTDNQKKNALKDLFNFYANTNDYQKIISISKDILNLKISKRYKYFVCLSISKAYLHNNEFDNAVYYAKEAEELYHKKIEAKKLLALIYKENNLTELAIEKYEEVLKSHKNEIDTLNNLGDIYRLQENYKKALEYYQQIENYYKNIDDSIYYNMAVCQKESGNMSQAENILEELYNKNKNEQICMLLAKVYQIEGFYKQGQLVLETYINNNEENVKFDVYVLLSQLYLLNKDYDKSKNMLLNFKSKNKSNNEIIDILLADSYYSLNQKQEAINIIKSVLIYTKSDVIKNSLQNILKINKTK